MKATHFITFTIAYLICLKVMKKIEPDNCVANRILKNKK